MSQPSISRSIRHICKLVLEHKNVEISFPNATEHYNTIKMGFHNKFGIKGVIGAIDCTHVAIIGPSSSSNVIPHEYMNRKGYYSINVEAICDDKLIFRHLNARFPGSCHDSGIWRTSPARIKLLRQHVSGSFKWLLDDSGYRLEPGLLTPTSNPSAPNEFLYNRIHIKARNIIERTFGVLNSRFRCLSKERVLRYTPSNAAFLVYTCSIFHNILQKHGICDFDEIDIENFEDSSFNDNSPAQTNQYYNAGINTRRNCLNSLTQSL
ncbi:putative nuclease HARBI1 [Bactrocera dorsalis]|uniref:Nuclease HARBI1 n=1 Tax=Bactrocera dorsalis TaxID=27457 RepID=A0ABM3JXW3_BACDO|nr:putative nuclease HARBI1 [Bactrocera dorsalis]